jgi:hypothetical protein
MMSGERIEAQKNALDDTRVGAYPHRPRKKISHICLAE